MIRRVPVRLPTQPWITPSWSGIAAYAMPVPPTMTPVTRPSAAIDVRDRKTFCGRRRATKPFMGWYLLLSWYGPLSGLGRRDVDVVGGTAAASPLSEPVSERDESEPGRVDE